MSGTVYEEAIAPLAAEIAGLVPDCPIIDAHTHLGLDEDGRSLTPEQLIAALDEVSVQARAPAPSRSTTPSAGRPTGFPTTGCSRGRASQAAG